MKKHFLSISILSVLTAICAGDAFGAASVRTLGGTGTYEGTTAAGAATRSVPSTRAGSLRVSPTNARLVTTNTNDTAATSTAKPSTNTQRLSIGKYLGGATTTKVTATGSASAEEVEDLTSRLESLETTIGPSTATGGKDLADRVAELETKQPVFSDSGVVVVDTNGEVSIDMDELKKEFFGTNDSVTMEYDAQSGSIKWGVANDQGDVTEWFTLVDTNDLSGDYVSVNELQDKIDDLGRYALASDLEALQTRVATIEETIESLTTGGSGSVATQITNAIGILGNKPGTETPYANVKEYIDMELEDYTTTADLGDLALKDKIRNADVADDAAIAASKIDGLADVATGGSFTDLNEVAALGDIEIGKVTANDGKEWVWGYVNGEPTFIRVVDEYEP